MRFRWFDCVVSANILNCWFIHSFAFVSCCRWFFLFIFLSSFTLKQTLMSCLQYIYMLLLFFLLHSGQTQWSGQQWAHFINISTHIFAHRISKLFTIHCNFCSLDILQIYAYFLVCLLVLAAAVSVYNIWSLAYPRCGAQKYFHNYACVFCDSDRRKNLWIKHWPTQKKKRKKSKNKKWK